MGKGQIIFVQCEESQFMHECCSFCVWDLLWMCMLFLPCKRDCTSLFIGCINLDCYFLSIPTLCFIWRGERTVKWSCCEPVSLSLTVWSILISRYVQFGCEILKWCWSIDVQHSYSETMKLREIKQRAWWISVFRCCLAL